MTTYTFARLEDVDATAAAASAAAAAVSAAAALASEAVTAADVVLTAADVVSTAADVVLTAADVVLTGLDVVSTAADVVTTAASAAAALVSENAAAASAATASTDATNAATSASNASTSATSAATAQSAAETAQTAAELAETNAQSSEDDAQTSEDNAATSETNAATSATNAATSATEAAASADAFDDLYLGSKASEPTLDNDGDALADGALFFDTTVNSMKVYDLGGTTWLALDGTIGGSLGAIDNRMVRTDGTTGGTLQSTGISVSDTNVISGATINSAANTLTFDLGTGSLTGSISEFDTALQSDTFVFTSEVGSIVQAWDAQLDSLSSASANGVSLITAASYAAMRTLLDLEAGTDFYSIAAADSAIAAAITAEDFDFTTDTVGNSSVDLDSQVLSILGVTGVAVTHAGQVISISTVDGEIVHDSLSGFVADEHILHAGVSVIAGTGLTGGGTISATRTLNVIGGTGITANANDIVTDANQSHVTTVGALNAGSITSGFTSIDLGSGTFGTTGTISGPSGSWDAGGMDLADTDSYAIAGVNLLVQSTGVATLSNIDALDATTLATFEDAVGAMLAGNTETLITVTYQGADNTIDFVVDNDLANYDNSSSGFITATLSDEQVEDVVGGMVGGASVQTGISVTYDDAGAELDFAVDVASLTTAGIIEVATVTETNTGTDAGRAVSPDGLDGWTGSAQVTTLGTIASGTWQGTTIAVNQGGTGITSFGAGIATFLGTPSTANLAAAVTGETGTGALVFGTSPTLVTPALGTPGSGVMTNVTGVVSFVVADESIDTTCFPLFATAVTGELGPKTGTNLTFNSATGLLFATLLSATTADLAVLGLTGSAAEFDTALQSDTFVFTSEVGSVVQAWDADLDTYAGITPSANVQSILAGATYAAIRALLDLEAGTDFYSISAADAAFQPLDADLTSIAALATTSAGRGLLTLADPGADRVVAWDDTATAFKAMPVGDITVLADPADLDFLLMYTAEGALVKIDWDQLPGAGGGISNIVEDTTPELGGNLDALGKDIVKVGVLTLTEQAAAEADVPTLGQVWVKTATPNQLWFTTDAGNDIQLTGGTLSTYVVTEADVTGHEAAIDHDALTNFASDEHFTQAAIVATGALDAGSITSGFTSIDVGAGAISTSGVLTGGTLVIGGASADAALHAKEASGLGGTTGNSQIIATLTGVTSNIFSLNSYVIRDDTGTDWNTARWHDAIGVDASFATPGTDTRCWYERDPTALLHAWGTAADTYMTIDGTGLNVTGTIVVSSTVDGVDIAARDANLTTAETKLSGIEASADVTDTTNVTGAGALMDSEVTSIAAIKDVILSEGLTIAANWEAADETKFDAIEALADVTDATNVAASLSTNQKTAVIQVVIDGGGSTITTGVKGYLEVPYGCTIQQCTLLADQSGSIVIDIWKDTYANYPPTNADTITASAVPTISTATKDQDATLTGWTTSIAAGDIIGFNVNSVTTLERVTLSLEVVKT